MLATYNTPLPSIEEIEEFSQNFNIPDDFKKFLKEHNGGTPESSVVRTRDNERVINCFLALKAPKGFYDAISNYLEIYRDRIPKETLPIASAGSSDLILISLDGTGKVYYWDHNLESDEDSAENYYENMEEIADGFSQLLDSL